MRHLPRGQQSFFAVLDESSASMDTTSEMLVYSACVKRKIGILSVAHRPTVIQFHNKVLHFEFDEDHVLRCRERPASVMAKETADMLVQHLEEEPRDRGTNTSSITLPLKKKTRFSARPPPPPPKPQQEAFQSDIAFDAL